MYNITCDHEKIILKLRTGVKLLKRNGQSRQKMWTIMFHDVKEVW